MSYQAEKTVNPRRGAWRLKMTLLFSLLISSCIAAGVLVYLKGQHDRQAHLAATSTVLQEGETLLNAICRQGLCCSTNPAPDEWRRFSTAVDSAFAVRQDVQSVTVVRNGITVFQRQADGDDAKNTPLPHEHRLSETLVTPGTVEINSIRQPVFVMSRSFNLDNGDTVVTEATLRREAVSAEEETARALVSSLFSVAVILMVLSFAICALVVLVAVTRDRRRETLARREEHLAFSGVLANGILHDFRNPMSAVRLDAQMLDREMQRPEGCRLERVHDLAARIARTMARMDKVFQEFLLLAKPVDEHLEPVQLTRVIQECLDTMAPRLEQANVTVQFNINEDLPPAIAHPVALRRALLNVLLNAIQFSDIKSAITVMLTQSEQLVIIDVLDRGPGIAANRREKIFDLFESGRPGGTGLGLFLARTAIRRCGGDMTAHGRDGGGADIRITLPLAKTSYEKEAQL